MDACAPYCPVPKCGGVSAYEGDPKLVPLAYWHEVRDATLPMPVPALPKLPTPPYCAMEPMSALSEGLSENRGES